MMTLTDSDEATFAVGFFDAFDAVYARPEWAVILDENLTCPWNDLQTEMRFLDQVQEQLLEGDRAVWSSFSTAYLASPSECRQYGGLLTPFRFSQIVDAMQPVSLFMTLVASWYCPMVLLPHVVKAVYYPRRLLVTPAYVLAWPWLWRQQPLDKDSRPYTPGGLEPISVPTFLTWLQISMQTVTTEAAAMRELFETMRKEKRASCSGLTQEVPVSTTAGNIWQDRDWDSLNRAKWSATMLSWTGRPSYTFKVLAAVRYKTQKALLEECPTLQAVYSKLGHSWDDTAALSDDADGISDSEVDAPSPGRLQRCEDNASPDNMPLFSVVSSKNKRVHRIVQRLYGDQYEEKYRRAMERVC